MTQLIDTIQFEEKTVRCQHEEHSQKEIQGACIYAKCSQYRLYCNICMKQLHADHVNELLDFADLNQWIGKQALLQQQLKALIDEIYFLHMVLLDFCSPSLIENTESQNELTSTKLNDKVNLAIRFSQLDPQFYQNLKLCQVFLGDFKNQIKGFLSSDQISKYFEKTGNSVGQQKQQIEKNTTCRLPLKFSTALKPKEIIVSTKCNTAKNNGYIGFIICEPAIPQSGLTRFAFKILKCSGGGGIGVGLCHKDNLVNWRFRPDLRNIGHGIYLFDKAGWTYSHIDKEMNCASNTMTLVANDIVIVEVDAQKSKVTWIKKQTNEQLSLRIDMSAPLYPCVELAWGQVEIISEY